MRKFTEDEIKEILRVARVFAPWCSEDQYRRLMELGQELADSELIEAAYGVHRLVQEYGTPCSEAPDKYLQLIRQIEELDSEIARLRGEREIEEQQLAGAVEAATRARAERSCEERELASFKREAEKEKERLRKELEAAMKEAQVTAEEIAAAGRLKAEVERRGLSLELALGLLSEFSGDEDAAGRLAEAVAEYGSQVEARAVLSRENEKVKAEIDQRRQNLATLEADCRQCSQALSQLRSDLEQEGALHRFHRRFKRWSALRECLAGWGQVIPVRCGWFLCGARFWLDRGPTGFRSRLICPCCGVGQLNYDDEPFMALGIHDRGPIKIQFQE